MNNTDIIQRFIFNDTDVRGEIVRLTHSFQTIIGQHTYPQTIRHLLGEALTVACLLNAIIKIPGRLTVQFQGKNPLKLLVAQCNHKFELRGLVQWQGDLSAEEISAVLKKGMLAIIISPDTVATPHQSMVEWQGESFAQSVEVYFRDSEQLPTRLWLAVSDTSAVGLLLQMMPKKGDQRSKRIEGDDDWARIIHLTQTITSEELLSLDNQTMLYRLYSQEEIEVYSPAPVTFGCTCSLERGENSILLLGRKEIEQELADKKKIVVTCEFCSKAYVFDRVDIAYLFKKIDGSSASH